ncbi:PHD finger protein 7-like [Armigeres subalbatus]|uniref:PHD finger protein 7-like n=1 Tax=Armigeres subalbatus TaxID=124917 RepID=UPI002ED4A1D8
MEYAEDLLVDQDHRYSGLDRILFLSCRRCMRYSPFLIYLPPDGASVEMAIEYVLCAGCVPPDSMISVSKSLINKDFLQLIKGFEYSNPFFRRYALIYRILITTDTRLEIDCDQYNNLPMYEKLLKLQEQFPAVHLLQNRRFSGLSEISNLIATRSDKIREYYTIQIKPKPVEIVMSEDLEAISSVESLSSPSVPVLKQTARLKLVTSAENVSCDVCRLAIENNTIQFGPCIEKLHNKETFRCHYLCLLSGTHIVQRGIDASGIFGFLINDVKQSFQKYRNNVCYCCEQLSAPIECNAADCKRYFHYICGYRKGCLTQFTGDYTSYCHEHLPIDSSLQPEAETECSICWDKLPPFNPVSCVPTFCEPENSTIDQQMEVNWFHRECLQKYAYEAGYYFKCPICHDKQTFPNHVKTHGIFVPMRDASWELDKTYFKDLHGCKCSAENCKILDNQLNTGQMVGCKACGGETLHLICAEISDPNDYVCSKCMDATFIKLL